MELQSGNIFIRPYGSNSIPDGHKHNFDHTTIVFSGAVKATIYQPGQSHHSEDFHAPAHFLVKAGVNHRIEPIPSKPPEYAAKLSNAVSAYLVGANTKEQLAAAQNEFNDTNMTRQANWWCVYSHRNPQSEIVQENVGWKNAYL